CPRVPAILVTAHGSESLAAEALGVGAAGYIAKENLPIILCESVRRMAAFTLANRDSLSIKASLTPMPFELVIDCMPERLVPVIELHLRMLGAMGLLHSSERIRIAEALHSVLAYCLLHCNLEVPFGSAPVSLQEAATIYEKMSDSDPDKTQRAVTLRTNVLEQEIHFEIRHDGDHRQLQRAPLPGTPQSFHDESSRGLLLLTSVMDEVVFGNANQISMVKYRPR
ncbi:MAG: hypothetical protein AAFV88_22195, partial [Planctomycetota bacterium]